MTKKTLGRRNRNGLTLDDLRQLVRDAEGMNPYVKIKGRSRMNGRIIELTIEEAEDTAEPVDSERDLWADPRPRTGGYPGNPIEPESRPTPPNV